MEKLLITQALNELKTLDKRINKEISQFNAIIGAKNMDIKVAPSITKVEFATKAKSSWNSINDLIHRREIIKASIIQSNANTYIELCGTKMTVAKAIDMKESIAYKNTLLQKMKTELANAENTVNKQNNVVESNINQLLQSAFGRDNKINPEDYESIANPYRKNNEYTLVDPLNLRNEIEKLENFIEEFVKNVDSQLQISNCITYIEF